MEWASSTAPRQLELQRTVALKMILSMGHAGADERARFRIEVEAAARIQHPNVVQVFEVGEHDGLLFCALEFVSGGTLANFLRQHQLAPREAARLVETLAEAMHFAHSRNVVHRDLKPANVLLTREGAPKISDFGLAKKLDEDSGQTRTGAILGTPNYMAPEQALGDAKYVGPAADVYALGAILYECLTGRPPFAGSNPLETLDKVRFATPVSPRSLRPAVPRDLETICLKCLRKEPSDRFASARELADDLQRFRKGEPVLARPVGAWERSIKWARRNPLAALLAAVFLLGVAGIAWQWIEADAQRRDAERQRHRAERNLHLAVEFNVAVNGLAERLRPLVGTRARVVEQILKIAAENYDRMLAGTDDVPLVLYEGKARMLSSFSDLYVDLNQSSEALRCAKESVELWQRVLKSTPADPAHRAGLAAAQCRLGRALLIRGDSTSARASFRDAASLYRDLAAQSPNDLPLAAETGPFARRVVRLSEPPQ